VVDVHRAAVSLGQLKVMAAIERCRTAALGGHGAACERCEHVQIAYNSCRNRHCPKCCRDRFDLGAQSLDRVPMNPDEQHRGTSIYDT
jgi:hypothetical protein